MGKNIKGKKDYYWHITYDKDRKKDKPANCIFLCEDRICHNKESSEYLAKCFRASWCPLREKEAEIGQYEAEAIDNEKKQKIIEKKTERINCSLPINIPITTKNKKETGVLVAYNKEKMTITVKFDKERRYLYPSCFTEGFLTVEEKYKSLIIDDIKKTKLK